MNFFHSQVKKLLGPTRNESKSVHNNLFQLSEFLENSYSFEWTLKGESKFNQAIRF